MKQNKRCFFLILITGLLITPVAWADCPVTLMVAEKREDLVLGYGGEYPKTHSVILKPTSAMEASEKCNAYHTVKEFHLNNVEQYHEIFQSLKVGDMITGTLNAHRPSPHGKMLHENFHHGFRLLTHANQDFSQEYIYFRHIGLY